MPLKRLFGLHENFELNDDWCFVQYWYRLLLWGTVELLEERNPFRRAAQGRTTDPLIHITRGEWTWIQMPTTQKNWAGPGWKVTAWLRTASRNPTIFRKLIIYKRKTLRKQSFELLCVSALGSKQGKMPYFPLSGTCFRRLTPEELSASCAS